MGKSRWPMNARAETSPANRAAPTTQAISTASVSGRHSRPCCVSAAEDGRRVELTLTARGRAVVAEAPDAAQDRLIAAIEDMPAYRRRLLAEGLAELARGVAATHRRAPMFFDDGHSQEDGGGRE